MKRHIASILLVMIIILGQVFYTSFNWEYLVGNKEDTIKIRSLPHEDIT